MLALEGALAENCSLEDLKRICRGHIIPDAMRVQTWHRLLGSPTFTSPDGLDSFNEIFDLENQSLLREDCQVFVGQLENDEEDKVSILSDLESLVTHYCKSHNLNYEQNNGWLHILTPLVSLKLPKNELYTYFSSILESYTPRWVSATWWALSLLTSFSCFVGIATLMELLCICFDFFYFIMNQSCARFLIHIK